MKDLIKGEGFDLRIVWILILIFPIITYLSGLFLPFLFPLFISDLNLPVNFRFNLGEPGWVSPLLSLTLSINRYIILNTCYVLAVILAILYVLFTDKVDSYSLIIFSLLLWIGDVPAILTLAIMLMIISLRGRVVDYEVLYLSLVSPANSFINFSRIKEIVIDGKSWRNITILLASLFFLIYHILTNIHFRNYILLILCLIISITLLLANIRRFSKIDVMCVLIVIFVILLTGLPSILATLPIIYYNKLELSHNNSRVIVLIPIAILLIQLVFLIINPQPAIAYNPKMTKWLRENLINCSRVCSISKFTYPLYLANLDQSWEYFYEDIDDNITSAQWIYQLYGPDVILGSKIEGVVWFPSDIYDERILTLYKPEYVHLSIIRLRKGSLSGPLYIYDIDESQKFKLHLSMDNTYDLKTWCNITDIKVGIINNDILVVSSDQHYSFTIIVSENYSIDDNENMYIRVKPSNKIEVISVNIVSNGKLKKIWYIRNPPSYWINYIVPISNLTHIKKVERLEVNIVGKGEIRFDYVICDYMKLPSIRVNFYGITLHNLSDKDISIVLRYNRDLMIGSQYIKYLDREFNVYYLTSHSNLTIIYDIRIICRVIFLLLAIILTLIFIFGQVVRWKIREE